MDYGKAAYDMCEQLQQRLQKLERTKQITKYKELTLTTYGGIPKTRFDKNFIFNVLTASQLIFRFSLRISGSEGRSQVIVYINGIKAKSLYTNVDETEFLITANVGSGECSVDVQVMYYSNISLNLLSLNVGGEVDYLNIQASISVINFANSSAVLYRNNNQFLLYSYYGGELSERLDFSMLSASISIHNNVLLLSTINDERKLIIKKIELSETEMIQSDNVVIDEGVTQVSGGYSASGFVVYAIKGSRVYIYDINEDLDFQRQMSSYSASRVFASKTIENAIILQDFNGSVKLVMNFTANEGDEDGSNPLRVIKLLKAENYHFEKTGDRMAVIYTINGNVLSRDFVDGYFENERIVSLTDEKIELFDGTMLERIRTELLLN